MDLRNNGLVSIGYGGRRIGEFVSLLVAHEVGLLVDVRESPRTRIPGFAGPSLARRLAEVGIDYRHEPDLGNPSPNRDAIRMGDPRGAARFRKLVDRVGQSALARLVADAQLARVAVLCAERDETRCHRSQVIDAARGIEPGLTVTPIS